MTISCNSVPRSTRSPRSPAVSWARRSIAAVLLFGSITAPIALTPDLAAASPPVPTVTLDWVNVIPQGVIKGSTPIVVTANGSPAVVVGDSAGYLTAYSIGTGTELWNVATNADVYTSCSGTGNGIVSPLSQVTPSGSDSTVYVDIAGAPPGSTSTVPDVEGFNADNGNQVSASNSSLPQTGNCGVTGAGTPGWSGPALAQVGGGWIVMMGSTRGDSEWGIPVTSGSASLNCPSNSAALYCFLNSDTSLSTPAIGQFPESDSPEVIETSDQTYNGSDQYDFDGGHLRILATSGATSSSAGNEIGNANLSQPTTDETSSSFDSSPAVASFGGPPLVIFGDGTRWTENVSHSLHAYDSACFSRWNTGLAGYSEFSPSVADVTTSSTPAVIEEVPNDGYDSNVTNNGISSGTPIVYVLNGATGAVEGWTPLTSGSGSCSLDMYKSSQSVVTADLSGSGYQDLVAPAGTCGVAILDGTAAANGTSSNNYETSGAQVATVDPSCTINGTGYPMTVNNTPVLTAGSSGTVYLTLAGWATNGSTDVGCVATYSITAPSGSTASLGTGDWPEFMQNPQLTGFFSTSFSEADVFGPDTTLNAPSTVYSGNGTYRAVMQSDGNFVEYKGTTVCWATGTSNHSGAYIFMQHDGNLVLYSSTGSVLWSTSTGGDKVSSAATAVMQNDAYFAVYPGFPEASTLAQALYPNGYMINGSPPTGYESYPSYQNKGTC